MSEKHHNKISNPNFRLNVLDNGLRVITTEMPGVQSASISLLIGVGSRHETDQYAGVSHFLEHIVFKGTDRRPDPKLISGAIEGVGGIINAETEQELTNYWCKVPANYVAESLDLLLDMIRNSSIDENEQPQRTFQTHSLYPVVVFPASGRVYPLVLPAHGMRHN